jgi:hypothetical protein
MRSRDRALPRSLSTNPATRAWSLAEDLIFSEGGLTLFFVLPTIIALFLIEAMPQF